MIGAILGESIGLAKARQTEMANYISEDGLLSIAMANSLEQNQDYSRVVESWEEKFQDDLFGLPIKNINEIPTLPPQTSKRKGVGLHVYLLGYSCYRLDDVLEQSARIASLTHEHYANTHVAQAVATAVFLANNRFSKRYIKAYFEDQYDFDLNIPYHQLKESYQHEAHPMVSVYRALISLLQSEDFEDALRISLATGDTENKQTFITGAIAEAYYQDYPELLAQQLVQILPERLQEVIKAFNGKFRVKATERFYEKLV